MFRFKIKRAIILIDGLFMGLYHCYRHFKIDKIKEG